MSTLSCAKMALKNSFCQIPSFLVSSGTAYLRSMHPHFVIDQSEPFSPSATQWRNYNTDKGGTTISMKLLATFRVLYILNT